MTFPAAVPELPVADLRLALAYYYTNLGFTLDWHDEQSGIAGVSKGACRLFLTDSAFREQRANKSPAVIWLNMESKSEVDELFHEWKRTGAKLLSEPEDKPWKLREFLASDLDDNVLRVFYDFHADN